MVCNSGCNKPDQPAPSGGRPPSLVRVTEIQRREVSPKIVGVGTVVPLRTSVVASGAEGIVKNYEIQIGEYVKKGDLLSELNMVSTDIGIRESEAVLAERTQDLNELEEGSRKEEIDAAKAKMLAAKALDVRMTARFKRSQDLHRTNSINQNDLDEAKESAEAARQAYLAAEANFRLVDTGPRAEAIAQARARYEAQKERLAFLQSEKAKRTTKAPFDGFVVAEHTYIGQWLSKGDAIVTLSRLDEVNIAVSVDQQDLAHIQVGREAHVTFPEQKTTTTGTIISIVPRSDWQTGSRGFPVLVRSKNQFADSHGKRIPLLKEGMMAEVTFTGQPVRATLVPKDAIVRTSRGQFIYAYQPEGNENKGLATQIQVETGLSDGAWIHVVGEGLDSAIQVVSEGAERLARPVQEVQLAEDIATEPTPDENNDGSKKP